MIGYLKGTLIYARDKEACLEIQGVGYRVEAPSRILDNLVIGQETHFWIETVVKEDSFKLYGFASPQERMFFNLLLTVSGVGPKAALNLLSALQPAELAQAIMQENLSKLSGVPGIGNKTAARISLELKEKVLKTIPEAELKGEIKESAEVLEFLISLGASRNEAEKAVKSARQLQPQANFETLLAESLKGLEKKS